jgi:predicted O-methyltransferase YrrM
VKFDESWSVGPVDLEWIEATSAPVHPVLAEIEAAAGPRRIPIVGRAVGRTLGAIAAGRPRIVEVGTAYGYSTLWMALAQPADGRIVTIDPDRARTDLARAWWRRAGVPDDRITVINEPALAAIAAGHPGLAGPFDLIFLDALKDEYLAYLQGLLPGLVPGGMVVADNALWSGRVSGARPMVEGRDDIVGLRAFNQAVLNDPRFAAALLPVDDGLLVATLRS